MARPQKEGLGYFPMDVDIDQDDKLIVPIAKHGMLGFGVIVRMMMEIYRNGYFYPWTEKERYVFPFKIGVEVDKVSDIIDDCIESGFFSEDQMVRNNILTSYGFQKRFLMASTRRKEAVIDPRFQVKKGENELLQTETELLHAETQKMSAISTQSKLKESKVNEIINNPSPNKKITYLEDSLYHQISLYFHSKITEHAAINKVAHLVVNTNLQKWADEFRKIIDLDKRDVQELKTVIDWATTDSFWASNILSPTKLRKQYVTLVARMGKPNNNTQKADSKMQFLQEQMKEASDEQSRGGSAAFSNRNSLPDRRAD